MKDGLNLTKIDQLLGKIKPEPVIVVIDDDPMTVDLLKRALNDDGVHIYHYLEAEKFLQELPSLLPDLIIMEAVLPGMSGLSVLEELRPKNLESVVPVLILSQKDDPRSKLLAFRRGAMDYLTKPFDVDELAARVRSLLRSKILQDFLKLSSLTDPLTSIPNRRFITKWLELEAARAKRYGKNFSCILAAVDDFASIQEKEGGVFSDFILREVSGLMAKNVRGSDVVGRVEGDRFLALLPDTSKEEAMVLARRLRALAAAHEFKQGKKQIKPTISLGIVESSPAEAGDAPALLQRAENALSKAQSVGKGQTAVL